MKKQKTRVTPLSASPPHPRARGTHQSQIHSLLDNPPKPLGGVRSSAPLQPFNSTFSVYMDPTLAPHPEYGPIPDEEFRRATLELEQDYNQKRRAADVAKFSGDNEHPATTAAAAIPSTQHPTTFPRNPLSVTSEHRTNMTNPSLMTSVNGSDVGSCDDCVSRD